MAFAWFQFSHLAMRNCCRGPCRYRCLDKFSTFGPRAQSACATLFGLASRTSPRLSCLFAQRTSTCWRPESNTCAAEDLRTVPGRPFSLVHPVSCRAFELWSSGCTLHTIVSLVVSAGIGKSHLGALVVSKALIAGRPVLLEIAPSDKERLSVKPQWYWIDPAGTEAYARLDCAPNGL